MSQESLNQPDGTIRRQGGGLWRHLLGISIILVLPAVMFSDVLFTTGDTVLSSSGGDIALHYVHLRTFGFSELKKGNLPLWNPHIFCGTPYVGGFLSAMFYPPNLIFMVLPLPAAINWCIAGHLCLMGLFFYLWAAYRGLCAAACTVCAVILMLCGAVFSHVFAGHVAQLCTMAYAPLLLLSIDGLMEQKSLRWVLAGMAAAAMQVLAGFPQYAFYTSLSAVLYLILRIIGAGQRGRIIIGFAAIFAGGIALSAVQLLAGMEAAVGSVREGGISYSIAGTFSLPPENLITFFAPDFFGSMDGKTYWGACYLWEMSVFISVTGLILGVYGFICGKSKSNRLIFGVLAMIMFILAVGSHTPLFKLLYNYVPGFNGFRGSSKFIYPMTLFILMLTGIGLDSLFREPRFIKRMSVGLLAAAAVIILAGWAIQHSAGAEDLSGWWAKFMRGICDSAVERKELYRSPTDYENPQFISLAGYRAAAGLYSAAGICAAAAVIILARRYSSKAVWAIALLAIAEMIWFARPLKTTFHLSEIRLPQIEEFLAKEKGDYRVLNLLDLNAGMSNGSCDISGYDAMVLRRYAELIFYAAGRNPDDADMYLPFSESVSIRQLYQMLRCRFMFLSAPEGISAVTIQQPLERFHLLTNYRVFTDRDAIFQAMAEPSFDPGTMVILESRPSCKPDGGSPDGRMRVIGESTDHLSIEADIKTPAILLVTDAYHPNWKIRALSGSSQSKYEVLAADYVLRAVPLNAGVHRFRMEYKSTAFNIGAWISVLSLIAYAGLVYFTFFQRVPDELLGTGS
jgi:hypothetical protein